MTHFHIYAYQCDVQGLVLLPSSTNIFVNIVTIHDVCLDYNTFILHFKTYLKEERGLHLDHLRVLFKKYIIAS